VPVLLKEAVDGLALKPGDVVVDATLGGGGGVTTTRRGVEKWLFYATIAIAVIFVGLSITSLFLQK
jgi:preprotein translocase subunit SecG